MKEINVYGSGCRNCLITAERIAIMGTILNLEIKVNKVTDLEKIMLAGVVSTPAVGIDGELVHAGSVPTDAQVEKFLQ